MARPTKQFLIMDKLPSTQTQRVLTRWFIPRHMQTLFQPQNNWKERMERWCDLKKRWRRRKPVRFWRIWWLLLLRQNL